MKHAPVAALFLSTALLAGSLAACLPSQDSSEGGGSPSPTAQEPVWEAEDSLEEPVPLLEPEPESPPLQPSLECMMETIDALCQEPRPLGSEAEYEAAQLLQGRLEEYGYESYLEPFSYNTAQSTLSHRYREARELSGEAFLSAALPGDTPNGASQNVVGRHPQERAGGSILVLSAHYDSTPDSLGVVDNAAGVAVLMEAARILAAEDLPFALRVVFFGGEEEILLGSRQHVLAMEPEVLERLMGNISVDTLAYSPQEEFAVLTPLALPQEDRTTLAQASPVAAALLADPRVEPEFRSQLVGDHLAFSAAGIDSVNFGQSMDEVSGIINSPADHYDLLEPELLPAAAQLLVEAVLSLAR